MHFSVLSSLTLPKDIPGAIKNMAVDDVANFATRKLYLKSLSDKKIFTPSEVASELTDLERWECFVETLAAGLLEPYNENTTPLQIHIEFHSFAAVTAAAQNTLSS